MPRANPYESFIKELKAVRLARGLTQAQLAEKIHLSRAQYTAIERGRSTANFRHIYNLAVALKVCWTVGDPDEPFVKDIVRKQAA